MKEYKRHDMKGHFKDAPPEEQARMRLAIHTMIDEFLLHPEKVLFLQLSVSQDVVRDEDVFGREVLTPVGTRLEVMIHGDASVTSFKPTAIEQEDGYSQENQR